jgi:ATP-dependent Lhr-like helicase
VLAATDPANPYGAALPWPEAVSGRAMRAAGVHVVIVDGALAAVIARGESEIVPVLPEGEPARSRTARGLAAAVVRWALRSGRTSLGWGGAPASADYASVADALKAAGYVPWGPGFRLAHSSPPVPPAAEETAGVADLDEA